MSTQIDEMFYYVLDTAQNVLLGSSGSPFPYGTKAAAKASAARKNGRFGHRFVALTWLLGKRV
jgi:hypothetical protein